MALLKRKRAGLNDPMSVVTRFVNACNRHDADAIFACLHPNFDSIQPMYPSRNFRGADQVRRNWQAIFDAEPGFRLTVLRSAVQDDIVWLELHGAGRDAEVAGVFVMGIQGDRIRWARIYSALVEPLPAGTEDASANLHAVPAHGAAGNGEVNDEAVIAPVVDIERSTRRRRRRSRRDEPAPVDAPAAAPEPVPELAPEPEAVAEPVAVAEPQPAPEPDREPAPEAGAPVTTDPIGDAVATQAEPEPEVLVAPEPAPEPETPAEAPVEATAAHDMRSELATGEQQAIVVEPDPEPEPEPEPKVEAPSSDEGAPKWRFGKKSR
jgi:ketosteroid isomerase-like protein